MPVMTMTRDEWIAEAWRELPAHRIELNGEREEPLIVQWAGDPSSLADVLAPLGYTRAPDWSLTTFTGFLAGQTPPEDLPALPRIQNGHRAQLVLVRRDPVDETTGNGPDGRWILRLWPSRFEVEAPGREAVPLYVGSLIHERILRPLNELSTPRTDRELPYGKENPLPGLPGTITKSRPGGSTVVLGGAGLIILDDTGG